MSYEPKKPVELKPISVEVSKPAEKAPEVKSVDMKPPLVVAQEMPKQPSGLPEA